MRFRGWMLAAGLFGVATAGPGCARGTDPEGGADGPAVGLGNEFPGDSGGSTGQGFGQGQGGSSTGHGDEASSTGSDGSGVTSGSGQGTGSSGQGGSFTGGSCDNGGACDACVDCAMQGPCVGPADACLNDAQCVQVDDCMYGCDIADAQCFDACLQMPGAPMWEDAAGCIYCDACPLDCPEDSAGCQ